jgi:anti-sigma-K factor RskA
MTCDDSELLLAAHAVGCLDPGEEAGLRVHLEGCQDCRRVGGVLLHVGTMIAGTVSPVTPPPSLRRNLMARVEAEARARSSAAMPQRSARWHRRLWSRVPSGRRFTAAGGLAAAAASLLAAWSLAGPRPAGAVAIRVPTCGSAGAPATRCVLDYDPDRHQAVLTATGLTLPAVLGGASAQTYEVWLIPAGGAPMPAAFLAQGPGGGSWSSVIPRSLHGSAAIAVTAEPAGGSLAPTGPEVLRVPLPPGI